jgi:hypothetical protein
MIRWSESDLMMIQIRQFSIGHNRVLLLTRYSFAVKFSIKE